MSDEWNDFEPWWDDMGRDVLVEIGGKRIKGAVYLWDSYIDEEGDEYPIWEFVDGDDNKVSWYEVDKWRYVEGED